ncbi:M48 family metalloprotease, partial [Streptomyces sp. 13-12-16]|uniref:M48 family metalloprotease n=1 Tax=Streptomyces sp. 13-12-16 TaxID=1570823 RepID=UPI001C4F7B69
MTAADHPAALRQRPPLPLISGTTLRFVLLAAIASALMMSLANNVADILEHVRPAAKGAYESCKVGHLRQIGEEWRAQGSLPSSPRECVSPYGFGGWWLIGLGVFWIAVGLVVWWLPAWRIRRRRYEEIGRVVPASIASDGALPDGVDLFALLARLQLGTDVAVPVTYLLDPLDPRCSALAFGRPGRRYVVLSGGLETLSRRDPVAFRVVLLHELAHIYNRDLDVGFLTIVAWRITMPLLVWNVLTNPLIPVIRGSDTSSALVALAFAASAMQLTLAVIVPLLRNSVLRSRELFADAQVKQWGVDTAYMDAMLTAYFPSVRRRRLEVLRVHPSLQRRRAVLHDSRLLGVTSAWDWCAVGVGAMVLHWSILQAWRDGPFSREVGIGAAAILVTGALGMAAWQDAVREKQPQLRGRGTGAASVGLGLGLAVGSSLLQPDVIARIFLVNASLWGQFLAWVPLMCLAAWAARRWLGAVAAAWADVAEARDGWAAKRVLCAVLGVAAVPLCLGLYLLTLGLQVSMVTPVFGSSSTLGGVVTLIGLPALFVLSSPLVIPLVLIVAVLLLAGAGAMKGVLRKGWLWHGIAAAALALYLLLLDARLGIAVGVVVVVQVVCAVRVALTTGRRQFPVAAATVAAFVTGLSGDLTCLVLSAAYGSWYHVAVGGTLGVTLGSVSAAVALGIRDRRARRSSMVRPRSRKPSAAASSGPWHGPPKVTWARRMGLWYGAGAALAAVLLVPFGTLLAIWGVIALTQVVCAVCVALTADWRPP